MKAGLSSAARRSARRSLLFVPGARPDRFDKAARSGADIVCVDLEDSVPPDGKDAARDAAIEWLEAQRSTDGTEMALRMNGLNTLAGLRDLAAFAASGISGGFLFLPKVDTAEELRLADAVLTETGSDARLMGLIESVDGLENVQEIASATPRLEMMMFGAADLAAELGVEIDHEPLLYARSRCVHAAKRAGVGLLDVPSLDFRNPETVQNEAEKARTLGFTGKAVLHPDNVSVVNAVFTPSREAVKHAREIVGLFERSATGLVVHNGKLIEAPVIRAMRNILAAAGRAGDESR